MNILLDASIFSKFLLVVLGILHTCCLNKKEGSKHS